MRFHIDFSSRMGRHFVTERWVARGTEVGPNMLRTVGGSKAHRLDGRSPT
jgi:hypothetical protein